MNDFLCVCSHKRHEHTGFWDITKVAYPKGCVATYSTDGSCLCWEYKADTLRYLEDEYVKRTIV